MMMVIVMIMICSFQIFWMHGYNCHGRTVWRFGTDMIQHTIPPSLIIPDVVIIINLCVAVTIRLGWLCSFWHRWWCWCRPPSTNTATPAKVAIAAPTTMLLSNLSPTSTTALPSFLGPSPNCIHASLQSRCGAIVRCNTYGNSINSFA